MARIKQLPLSSKAMSYGGVIGRFRMMEAPRPMDDQVSHRDRRGAQTWACPIVHMHRLQMNDVVRGDSGFCREELMAWCEEKDVDFLLGLSRNSRLQQVLAPQMAEARQQFEATNQAARVFLDFEYQTRKSWSRSRRIVGKAEYLAKGENPRFVATSFSSEAFDARSL